MGHSEDDAVHKIPHKENTLAEIAGNFGIGLIWNPLKKLSNTTLS